MAAFAETLFLAEGLVSQHAHSLRIILPYFGFGTMGPEMRYRRALDRPLSN